jgi:hypothetical protein
MTGDIHMRTVHALASILLLLGSLPVAASVLLFDQTPTDVDNGVFTSTSSVLSAHPAGADDFEVGEPFALNRIVFWSLQEQGSSADGTLSYAIWADDDGLMQPQTTAITNATLSSSEFDREVVASGIIAGPATYDQVRYEFDIVPIWGLKANQRYWLSIYLGDATGLTNSQAFLWQQTTTSILSNDANPLVQANANTAPPGAASWISVGANDNLAVQLYGSTPVPGTAVLLLPLLGFATWLHRRASRARA